MEVEVVSKVDVTLACGLYDRTLALHDGSVTADGLNINFLPMRPSSLFRRQARNAEFDVAEFSFSTYCMLRSRGDLRMIAIPVFPSRKFRHSHIFVKDESIRAPADLVGKRVGMHEYQNTASTWIRGILKEEYGVGPEDVHWVLAGLNAPKMEGDRIPMDFGADMKVTRADDRYLTDLLETGEIAAIISAEVPDTLGRSDATVRRLFPDYVEVEQDYFRRTGIFPIMHTVVVKSEIYQRHPWVAKNLMEAFEKSKEVGSTHLRYSAALFCSLPWLGSYIEETDQISQGADLFPYGLEPNRMVLEKFIEYSFDQGLIKTPLAVEDLFAKETV
jgi:4,5-dihydroxyphthalate decarboxylase